jgi:hypothetical protein
VSTGGHSAGQKSDVSFWPDRTGRADRSARSSVRRPVRRSLRGGPPAVLPARDAASSSPRYCSAYLACPNLPRCQLSVWALWRSSSAPARPARPRQLAAVADPPLHDSRCVATLDRSPVGLSRRCSSTRSPPPWQARSFAGRDGVWPAGAQPATCRCDRILNTLPRVRAHPDGESERGRSLGAATSLTGPEVLRFRVSQTCR